MRMWVGIFLLQTGSTVGGVLHIGSSVGGVIFVISDTKRLDLLFYYKKRPNESIA